MLSQVIRHSRGLNCTLAFCSDLRTAGVDCVTLGQYMQPTKWHLKVSVMYEGCGSTVSRQLVSRDNFIVTKKRHFENRGEVIVFRMMSN